MVIVALSTWIVFCMRDYGLLQLGPPGRFRSHARCYALSGMIACAVVCLTLRILGSVRALEAARSPRSLGAAVLCHVILTVVCLCLARKGIYDGSWALALIPLPAPWISLVIVAASFSPEGDGRAVARFVLAVTLVWIATILTAARLDGSEILAVDEDFSVRFAGWSNCMVCCLVPLMIH